MPSQLTRRTVARHVAEQIAQGADSESLLQQLAANLIANRKTKQFERYVADIENELASHGIVVADVTTARPLQEIDSSLRQAIETLVSTQTGGRHVTLREHVDQEIIGGVVIRTAGTEYDRSIKGAIRALKRV